MFRNYDRPYYGVSEKQIRKIKYQIRKLNDKSESVYLYISEIALKHKFESNVYELSNNKLKNIDINSQILYLDHSFSNYEQVLSVNLKNKFKKTKSFERIEMSVESFSSSFYKLNLKVKLSGNISYFLNNGFDFDICLLLKFEEYEILKFINDELKIDTELHRFGVVAPVSLCLNKSRLRELKKNYDFMSDLNIFRPKSKNKQYVYYICNDNSLKNYEKTQLDKLLIIENVLNKIQLQNYDRMRNLMPKKLNSRFYRQLLKNSNHYQQLQMVINILLSEEKLNKIQQNKYLENKRKYLIQFKKYVKSFNQEFEKITQKQQKISEATWKLLNNRFTALGVAITLVALIVALCQWTAFINIFKFIFNFIV